MTSLEVSDKKSRMLGIAFLIQGISSMASAIVWGGKFKVAGNIHQTLINIANNPVPVHVSILLDMVTACGVIFLGAVLFVHLKKQSEKIALAALGFYVLEGAIIAAAKFETHSLLSISREYAVEQTPYLLISGRLALEAADFSGPLLMWAFSIGGILFYYLLDKSRLVPRALSLWGLASVILCLVGTLAALIGHSLPFVIYFPYIPFEYAIGIYILLKGVKNETWRNK